jgi:hypothetical protein
LALCSFIACMFFGAAQYLICSTQMNRMSENRFISWNINWTLYNLCSQLITSLCVPYINLTHFSTPGCRFYRT